MAFRGVAKRSHGAITLYNKVLSSSSSSNGGTAFAASRHKFSTWASKRVSLDQPKETQFTAPANHSCGSVFFLRRFSAETSSTADQLSLIKQLRERTSAPIKDVKAALIDSNWDIEAAQKDLRKRGKVLASKKASRTAAEGLLALALNDGKAALIELNCETDFVARNEIFQYLALALAKKTLLVNNSSQPALGIFPVGPEYLEEQTLNLEHPKLSGEITGHNAITEVAAKMGENVKLRRGFVLSASTQGVVSTYLHTSPQPGLGRIAGVLSLEVEDGNLQSEALRRVGSELAMHVVAAKPLFLTKELVTSEALENEREILKSQAESSGKSQMAIEKMVEGRLRKYYEDVVLMEQKFVMNDSITVKTLLDNLSKEVGSPVKIGNFFRMEVGEGIER
ncbi:Translation elongation factor [Trema orientale]|uniref:Elongation factor Ts, mitochondrial n=1 Tax=Trema orientale TaxID=63057 RepID=A0A2P5BN86_TREOI|nr:Translation elongation factor [Trema orientale]